MHDISTAALDPYQLKFCRDTNRNIRLLAPAGSGKTHSLLYRCAEVYRRQSGSAKFLLITFTRAARDELRKRLARPEFKDVCNAIEVTTLNSWGWRRVRSSFPNPRLMTDGYDRHILGKNVLAPVIERHEHVKAGLDTSRGKAHDQLLEAMDLCKGLGFDHTRHAEQASFKAWIEYLSSVGCGPMLASLYSQLERLKIVPDDGTARALAAGETDPYAAKAIYDRFFVYWCDAVEMLLSQSFFTFEDQKYAAARLLEEAVERKQLPVGAARYTDILVDEFQDINPLDLRLIGTLVNYNASSITICGDDDQAIFEWRGSVPDFILNPEKNFSRTFTTHILENNYRCPDNIVEASKRLIVNNKRRVAKTIRPQRGVNADVEVLVREDFGQTIDTVLGVVQNFLKHRQPGERIALMARKRAQLIPYQIVFASEGISFCAAEDLQVFLSDAFKQLKDVIELRASAMGAMRSRQVSDGIMLLVDKFKRYPLKRAERQKLEAYMARAPGRSFATAIDHLEQYDGTIKGYTGEAAQRMLSDIAASARTFIQSTTVAECLGCMSENFQGFEKDYGKSKEEIFYADPPFYYLSKYAAKYGSDFDAFLDDIDRAIETLVQLPADEDNPSDVWERPVHLMTALRAKGREFDEVVLLDVNDGIWPTRQAVSEAQLEQERRVFYVAMTRPKRKLWLTVSARIGDDPAVMSPYLKEAGFAS